MSGAAALASARRRRAAPQGPVAPTNANIPSQSSSSQNNSSNMNANDRSIPNPPQRQTPTQMLLNHNTLIQNLQEVVSTLNEVVDKNVIPKEDIEKIVQGKVNEGVASQKMTTSNIAYFKDKYETIEAQMKEIKKQVLKIQSFAMDTNLQCIELKKRMNRDKNYETIDQVKKMDETVYEISQESRTEHLTMLKQNTALNKILETDEDDTNDMSNNEV